MDKTIKKHYTCKRLRMCEYLIKQGFTPTATIPDATNPRFNWWLFEQSPELETAVNTYFELLKSRTN